MSQQRYRDQLGNEIQVSHPPQRIISLVPSQTEFLADLDLEDRVTGITKFCVHPETWRKSKTIIGGTKKFNFDVIHSLKPDLIIGNKEENYAEGIAYLQKHYPVWMSDIVTLQDALDMMRQVGELTGREVNASAIVENISQSLAAVQKLHTRKTLYLIWKNPWMGAASGTFIHEMLSLAGLQNSLAYQTRYPELTAEAISALNPELIFLSSEPYPFKEIHVDELQQLCPAAKILLVDGEIFSWYGSRLLQFPAYLENLRRFLS